MQRPSNKKQLTRTKRFSSSENKNARSKVTTLLSLIHGKISYCCQRFSAFIKIKT